MRRLARLLPVAVCAALAGPAAAAQAATVAQPGAATQIRELGGTNVFSEYDRAAERWFLAVRDPGDTAPRRIGVPSSARPFQADIGTDSKGRPQLIYQRCDEQCDLYVYSLAPGGGGERPVRNANDPEHDDYRPTLSRGRMAWVRAYGSGASENPIVYTKTLTQPRSQPSKRLPGVPQQRTGDVDRVTGPTTARDVQALELDGDNLAVIVDYTCEGCSGIAQTELRLDSVKQASSRQVAFSVVGMNGQQFVGPSFFGGMLAWYRTCNSSDQSCTRFAGPWRHDIARRTYLQGARGPYGVRGFTDTGTALYERRSAVRASRRPPRRTAGSNGSPLPRTSRRARRCGSPLVDAAAPTSERTRRRAEPCRAAPATLDSQGFAEGGSRAVPASRSCCLSAPSASRSAHIPTEGTPWQQEP